jgi:hypothetical protein
MDLQTLANVGLTALTTIFIGVFGYLYRQKDYEIKTTQMQISNLQVIIAQKETAMVEKYVAKDDLAAHLNRIENMLTKIFDRLENKADKP